MRKIAVLFFVLTLSTSIEAQTITLAQVTRLVYCVGDTMTVSYSTSGSFNAGNKFIVQLSEANGSFGTFTNLATADTTPGNFKFALTGTGSHFRVRIESTNPYLLSADNGADIEVSSVPAPNPADSKLSGYYTPSECHCYFAAGFEGDPIVVKDFAVEPAGSTYAWTFNEDANPSTSSAASVTVTYATPGAKDGTLEVTAPAGCASSAVPFGYRILSCNPVIPANARIVNDVESGDDSVVWVQAGGTYSLTGSDFPGEQFVFAEPGSSIIDNQNGESFSFATVYLKAGSSFSFGGEAYATVVTDDSNKANVPYSNSGSIALFTCSNFNFDYSKVQAGVAENPPPSNLTILQSGDHLFANDEGLPIEIRISNLLGVEVLSQQGSEALDVDLSLLPAGVYFAVVEAGNDRTVRRIAVIH